MENAADDPRQFAHEGADFDEGDRHGTPPPALDALFCALPWWLTSAYI
jgi:hypothetical protein